MADEHTDAGEDETHSSASQPENDANSSLPEGIPDPDDPPDLESDPHVLPADDLVYPTFQFDTGTISPEEGFSLSQDLDRDELVEWLDSLAGANVSHDLAVEGENLRPIFGIAPADVELSFEPDGDQTGTLSVTFNLKAKVMRYESADERPRGARGNRGFIPIEMLTGDRDPGEFRCYNWIDDPLPADGESPGGGEGVED